MTLDLAGEREDPLARVAELVEVVGGEQPGDDRRGGGAEPAGERDLAAQPEGDLVGGMQPLEGADEQVVATGADVEPAGVERVLALLGDLELELEGRAPRRGRRSRARGWPTTPELGRSGCARSPGHQSPEARPATSPAIPRARTPPSGTRAPGSSSASLTSAPAPTSAPGADHQRARSAARRRRSEQPSPNRTRPSTSTSPAASASAGRRPRQLPARRGSSTAPVSASRLPCRYSRQRPDVVPVGVDLVHVERHVVLEQRREDVEREVDRVVVGEVVEDLGAERVDHAVDEVRERLGGVGLLLEALDPAVGAGDDHAVLADVGDLLDGERRDPAVARGARPRSAVRSTSVSASPASTRKCRRRRR